MILVLSYLGFRTFDSVIIQRERTVLQQTFRNVKLVIEHLLDIKCHLLIVDHETLLAPPELNKMEPH